MLNHADISAVLKILTMITSKDSKSLDIYRFVTLTPKKKVVINEGDLFAEEETQDMIVLSFDSIDKFRIEYEIPCSAPLDKPLVIPAKDALLFLEKAKTKPGDVVTIKSDVEVVKEDKKTREIPIARLGYLNGGKVRSEVRLDSLHMLDMFQPLSDLQDGPDRDVLTVDAKMFTKYLRRAETSASKDDTRPNLTWICTAFKDGNMAFTTTDGHRLYRAVVNGVEGVSTQCTDTENPLFITQRIADILLKVLDDSKPFTLTVQRVRSCAEYEIRQDNMRLLVKDHCDGRFPDFSQILPRVDKNTAIQKMSCPDVVEACELATAFKNMNESLRIRFKGDTATFHNEKFTHEADIKREGALHEVLISVSSKYLKESLTTLFPDGVKKNRTLTLKVWDTISPMIMSSDTLDDGVVEEYQVVMPMRL